SFKVSTKGITILKKIFTIKDRDPSKVLKKTMKVLKDYESGINAAENLEEIVNLCKRSSDEMDILVEPRFARGLEYYTGMIFEVFVPEMDISLGGGGRYDKLVEMFGGESTPAVGVAHGLDRISLALEKQNAPQKILRQVVALVPIGEKAVPKAVELASQLRKRGIHVEMEIMGRTVSRALQDADRREASHAIIMGPKEIAEKKVMLRDLRTRQQRLIDIQELFKTLER
ncbi:ATP phosphoribosyltransferase regulatory subunit, partial [Candidatus Bathyarchaeota archaeon]|nr:ATP phosphoribosyltransferase regulatory subunit [Candidatus Bathyarchaeota archaeon]